MNTSIVRVGYRSALLAFLATSAFVVVQTMQLVGWFTYPWDEILIYSTSLCITIPFILAMLALHYTTPAEKKFWSHAALLFTIIYSVFVIANYVVQLATVIPMTLSGTAKDIQVLVQTPHSLFWDYDAIGYIFMGFAALIAIPVFERTGLQRWVRLSFLVHGLVTPLIAFVYFYPSFSTVVLLLGIPWAITAPVFMFMLALMFRRELA